MAMNTYVQMVSSSEIDALRATPTTINQLDKSSEETYTTYYLCSINYFLTGDAYPDEHPLAPALFGAESIPTPTLENGGFGVTSPTRVGELAAELAKIDVDSVAAKIEDADPDQLADEEVDDFELLVDQEPVHVLSAEIRQLIEFYARAAEQGKGVAIFTT